MGSRLSIDQFRTFLDVAAAGHVNLIDTADFYGSGDSERLIARGLKATGHPFFVVTKAGLPCVHTPGWLSPLNQIGKKIRQRTGAKNNYTAGYLIDSVQKSNKRLGVDAADALLLHEPAWDDIADSDSWDGLARIRQSGLARYTGVSTDDYRVVEEGIRSGQVQVVQTPVSWLDSQSNAILELCRMNNVPVIANQVLRPHKVMQDRFRANEAAVHQVDGLAGISLVQVLIAAVLAERPVHTVLFGTSDPVHLAHNIDAIHYRDAVAHSLPILTRLLT